ncbi:MAG: hypothetical protein HY074_18830 [Deltaproteobacteria bacterium]|nr:hypothetical protein [Deltaproteobacteria bacterium]
MMTRGFIFSALFSIFALIACAFAILAAERPRDGLWVTFETAGQRHRVHVADQPASDYVRSFAAGEAAQRVPEKFATAWLRTVHSSARPESVHVTRAEECRRGACQRLRGLYAGRSPTF